MKEACSCSKVISVFILVLSLFFLLFFSDRSSRPVLDGEYIPARFSFSGGSGRIDISCDHVVVKDGVANAEIVFSSPHYTYVKVGDETYYGSYTDNTSHFDIPVEPEGETEIIGCTTAMQSPHEIEYTLYMSLSGKAAEDGSNGIAADAGGNADGIDAEGNDGSTAAGGSVGGVGSTVSIVADGEFTSPPEIEGLTYLKTMPLEYAECFKVYYYSDDHKVIEVTGRGDYLIVPQGKSAPANLPEGIKVIKNTDNIYLAATGVMSLFYALNADDHITMTGTKADGWHIDGPAEALGKGDMVYAGKYSAPDYELLIQSNCGLAIESTMIYHCPEVMEEIEALGIPVFVDFSSYEKHALGRSEWIKLYGALVGKKNEADRCFKELVAASGLDKGFDKTGKSVAFFYIDNAGLAVIRKDSDYVAELIRDGGGDYLCADKGRSEDMGTNINISMEAFYDLASDADYLIYNATIDSSVSSVDDLLRKNELLAGFKAVKDGNVYLAGKDFYQSTERLPLFAGDVNRMIHGENGMVFLEKME